MGEIPGRIAPVAAAVTRRAGGVAAVATSEHVATSVSEWKYHHSLTLVATTQTSRSRFDRLTISDMLRVSDPQRMNPAQRPNPAAALSALVPILLLHMLAPLRYPKPFVSKEDFMKMVSASVAVAGVLALILAIGERLFSCQIMGVAPSSLLRLAIALFLLALVVMCFGKCYCCCCKSEESKPQP